MAVCISLPPTHEPYLPLLLSGKASLPFGWYSLRLRPRGWPGWVDLCGWLHTEINVRHRELNPDTVTHPTTNPARFRLTSLIETNALPLRQTTTLYKRALLKFICVPNVSLSLATLIVQEGIIYKWKINEFVSRDGCPRWNLPPPRTSRATRSAQRSVWNSLPATLTSQSSLLTFRQQLKTLLFERSYPWLTAFLYYTTYLAVLFFYFVTCPCSSRTKRHDNLFVDDDDDDDDSLLAQNLTGVDRKSSDRRFFDVSD